MPLYGSEMSPVALAVPISTMIWAKFKRWNFFRKNK